MTLFILHMVILARGIHLFPFRTQKLSLFTPMVLGWRRPGRVGNRQIRSPRASALGFCFIRAISCESRSDKGDPKPPIPEASTPSVGNGFGLGCKGCPRAETIKAKRVEGEWQAADCCRKSPNKKPESNRSRVLLYKGDFLRTQVG